MSTRAIDPSTLTFAKTLVRIKAKQLLRVIRDAATGSQQDLEQDLLLEVVVRWPGFDPAPAQWRLPPGCRPGPR